MGKHTLVLGGGFGGLAAADTLRRGLGSEHTITLVDRQPLFLMGLTKLWVLDRRRQVGQDPGNRTLLPKRGIDFLEGEVTSINPATREVRVGRQNIAYDYLVIALGADYSSSSPIGIARYAKNLYTESGCAEIRDALHSLQAGTVTILVCGLPFKCPPAPYEASMIIDDILRKKGVRGKVQLQIVTPEPHPLTILGPQAGAKVTALLEERGIAYHPREKVKEIQQKGIVTESGKRIAHDLVLAVPIHVAPQILKESGMLDESGWIQVDASTLATKFANVYAVGDCAGTKVPKGLLLPRAGVLAEAQGKVVAQNIIHQISGGESTKFDGKGVCYMEVGGEKAAPLQSNFFAQPNPTWDFTSPSEDGYRQKERFLEERMKLWFG